MTDCVFTLKENKLTRVSGADAGTYMINDNYADIAISSTEYRTKVFDGINLYSYNNYLTISVDTS